MTVEPKRLNSYELSQVQMSSDLLNAIYLDYVNNYISVEGFAERNEMSKGSAQLLLALAREYHERSINLPSPDIEGMPVRVSLMWYEVIQAARSITCHGLKLSDSDELLGAVLERINKVRAEGWLSISKEEKSGILYELIHYIEQLTSVAPEGSDPVVKIVYPDIHLPADELYDAQVNDQGDRIFYSRNQTRAYMLIRQVQPSTAILFQWKD